MTLHNYVGDPGEQQRAAAKADAVLTTLQAKTPAEIEAWVDANVTTAAEMKTMFKRILIMLAVLARDV